MESVAIVNVGALITNDDDFFESLERYHIKIQSSFSINIGEWLYGFNS